MVVSCRLKGLTCAACAQKIEEDCADLPCVSAAHVNVLTQKLRLEFNSNATSHFPLSDLARIVHRYEPDIEIEAEDCAEQTLTKVLFSVTGLTCPNCAQKIEHALLELPGVCDCQTDLLRQTLTIACESEVDGKELEEKVSAIVARYESDVLVTRRESQKRGALVSEETENSQVQEGRWLLVSVLLFALALLVHCTGVLPPVFDLSFFVMIYLMNGHRVLRRAFEHSLRGNVFDENFLMSVATLGAFVLEEYPEACCVMLFYRIGEYFQTRAVLHSKRSIAALMKIRPDSACVLRNGREWRLDPEEVVSGEMIVVRPGERIPLDGRIMEGRSSLDTSALTGESLPRQVVPNDEVLSGCINQGGLLKIAVEGTYASSTVARVLALVEDAQSRKAPTEQFISSFARWYTPLVVGLSLCLALVPPLMGAYPATEWIRRAFVFLIVSCPCALVLSIPLTFFGGIGVCSREGILVKGSNYLEALSALHTVVFDKTGSLTEGVFAIQKILPCDGIGADDLLRTAAQAVSQSSHPVGRSVLDAWKGPLPEVTACQEVAGRGVSVRCEGHSILAGNALLLTENGITPPDCHLSGTKLFVARDGICLGVIVVADRLRSQSAYTLQRLRAQGVQKLVMLTGDNAAIASEVNAALGFDRVEAELLPDQKVAVLEELEAELPVSRKLAFVGDGINDAPVLARADVGIAMGGLGADAAIEAADVVLMTDDPSKIARAVEISRTTKRIVVQNIVLALGIKCLFLLLGALGLIGLWMAVFGDVGVTLLAVANALRIARIHPATERESFKTVSENAAM